MQKLSYTLPEYIKPKNLKREFNKSPVFELTLFVAIIWLAIFYFKFADFIYDIGLNIGEALAR